MNFCGAWLIGFLASAVTSVAIAADSGSGAGFNSPAASRKFVSRAGTPPRKIVVSAALADFSGGADDRVQLAGQLIDRAAAQASAAFPGRRLDLQIFPEFAFCRSSDKSAAAQALTLESPVVAALGAKAREHRTWIVAPMVLREDQRISNAAVLLDREGKVAGIFRKVHPIADEHGVFEGGVTPGGDYPVFDCDFGRLGILICWDMSYDDAWEALAARGAEFVALPSASPQTLRPMAAALRHHFYVATSTPRDNASLFDPIGRTIAQATGPGVSVTQIDLAYAILHWNEKLHEGRALTSRFGDKVGFSYSTREDTGVFWSNDSQRSIGSMIAELGLREMPFVIEDMQQARDRALLERL